MFTNFERIFGQYYKWGREKSIDGSFFFNLPMTQKKIFWLPLTYSVYKDARNDPLPFSHTAEHDVANFVVCG